MNLTTHFKQLLTLVLLASLALAGCGGEDNTPAQDEPLTPADLINVVSASGKVMPGQWATLSFESGGHLEWLIDEGSQVAAGDELARLNTIDQELAVEQARAFLATAEAELARAEAGPRTEDIAAANGAVMIAEGNVIAAEASLTQVDAGTGFAIQTAEAGLAQAQGALAAANAEVAQAQAHLAQLEAGPRAEEIAIYQARVNQAQAEFLLYENIHYDQFVTKDIGGGPEERARYQREGARGARDAAQAQLDLINAGASAEDIAAARAVVSAARSQVTIAQAGVTAAEVVLAQAQTGEIDKAVAQAQVQIAQGQQMQADAQRDRLEAGATAEEIGILKAQVSQANAALAQAEAALQKAVITAPFAGTVGTVYLQMGETIIPGISVLVLGDTSTLRVETTDLNEVDATQIDLDSPVTLTFDALPGQVIEGSIVRMAPMASSGQGGTNFTAVIALEDPPSALRWGMTAFVDIEVE